MRLSLRIILILAFVAFAPVFCFSDEPTAEEIENNERLLEQWRSDPDHMGRLQNDLRAFWQLPAQKQERLRQLDQELHATDSVTQRRLWVVIERYAAWYDRLAEGDQRRLDKAKDRNDRLKIVKQLLEDQWLQRQPQKTRDYFVSLVSEDQRHEEIAKQRKDDRQRIDLWMRNVGIRRDAGLQGAGGTPVQSSDFSPEGERYINDVLKPMLSSGERDQLRQAEGKWPSYVGTVLELSEKHPLKLPGPSTGYTKHNDLPKEYRDALSRLSRSQRETVERGQGKWPDFAITVTEMLRPKHPTLTPLGPSKLADFDRLIRDFVEKDLAATLSPTEKEELKKAEGRWPEYPRTLLDLAAKYNREVPLMRLPNTIDWQTKVAAASHDVPDRVLRDFALNELTAEDWKRLNLNINDPLSRQHLVEEFFKKKPDVLKLIQHNDHQIQFSPGRPPTPFGPFGPPRGGR
jgi:hypothetical protein